MEKPKPQRNTNPSLDPFKAFWKDLAEEQNRMRVLREQRELIRLQREKELWRSASTFPKGCSDPLEEQGKSGPSASRSDFFTKLRLGKLLG